MFPEITYSQNAALKQKTYDKYYSDGVVVLVDGAFEVDGEKTYGTLKAVLADATEGAQIKFASYIKADIFVTQDVTFVPNNFGYGNIFVADTNGDADIDVLDFIKLTKKIADDEGTVEINTAGLDFKASYAAKNMTKLKKYLLGLAV